MDEMMFDKMPGFDKLLKSKDFDDLSESEKSLVMQFMSREEYEALRIPIHNAYRVFSKESENIIPDPRIRQQLLDKFGSMKRPGANPSLIRKVFTYRIPVYQAGIAAVMLLCIAIYFGRVRSGITESSGLAIKTDTIFIEKLVEKPGQDAIAQVSVPPAKKPGSHLLGKLQTSKIRQNYALPERYASQVRNMEKLVSMNRNAKKGRNAEDDSLLMKLLVTVN
jgi:hypothetical protein